MAATIGSMLQLVLDMFAIDDGTAAAPARPPARKPRPRGPARRKERASPPEMPLLLDPEQASAPAPAAGPAAPPAAAPQPPAVPLRDVVHAVAFTHPQANAQVHLGDAVVGYLLRRARRRTIGFSVAADGLVVSVPNWISKAQVQEALQQKSTWIVRKLRETRERQQRLESARIDWKGGAVLPFLGQPMRVVLDPRHGFTAAGAVLRDVVDAAPGAPRAALHLALPQQATPEQIRDAVQAWLMRQAKRIFTERLDHFAPRLQVQWKKMALSSAGTRWGSARADGSIRLHWRLVHYRMEVIDYVVAHELSHLRVMDHSPRFWDTVASVVPDYAELRDQLRDDALPAWR